MKKLIYFNVYISIFFWIGSAWAIHYMESLIYTGPPEYGEVYDYSENSPTYVSWTGDGRDLKAHADWWTLGGRLDSIWDNTYQGWTYVFSDMEKEFEVTAAGSASITFSWYGLLEVIGNSAHDEAYYLYANASIEDTTRKINPDEYWYYELVAVGKMNISENATFNYIFDEQDVGDIFKISLVFDTQVSIYPYGSDDIIFADGESLEFTSSFYNGLKIDSITGGIAAADEGGPLPAVPLPSAAWLLGSGVIGIVGIRRKFKN